jgi:pyruvate,orthophosphate dikinase
MMPSSRNAVDRAVTVHRIPYDGSRERLPPKEEVGSKAHYLMRMAMCGLVVPPAFVLSSSLCRSYASKGSTVLDDLEGLLSSELDTLGRISGRVYGDARRPLIVSVRSGAAVSMPGMMETVLNIGLTVTAQRGLLRMTGNPRLVQDCRRRLVQQYGEVVHGITPTRFEECQKVVLAARDACSPDDLDTQALRELGLAFEGVFEVESGKPFPDDPMVQIKEAVEAVLKSWSSDRAKAYRKLNGISDDLGTAVTVQAMVFGNLGPNSGSGVGFTRNPANGTNELYVDYLPNAQGEDVVSGRRRADGVEALKARVPEAYRALAEARTLLEREFSDMQDFEFTVENGHLLLLQCRPGKRTPLAALRIARDLVAEQILAPLDAARHIAGLNLEEIDEARLDIGADDKPVLRGIGASVGVAVGAIVYDPTRVAELHKAGKAPILVRPAAETADVAAFAEAEALIASSGARTSHAAVVARQLAKPCIVGCAGLVIDSSGRWGSVGTERFVEGDIISLDGGTGEIYRGALNVVRDQPHDLIAEVRKWQQLAKSTTKSDKRRKTIG